jgi:hypothetical protein
MRVDLTTSAIYISSSQVRNINIQTNENTAHCYSGNRRKLCAKEYTQATGNNNSSRYEKSTNIKQKELKPKRN